MISQLYIENIAVIEKTTVDFTEGFNVFTGETGAGKSILIDAINAVMGERFAKELIRNGETKASVTATFTGLSNQARAALEDLGYEADDELLIYRSIGMDGKNVCRINGRPATVSILKEMADYLVNIHGQHDNQALLVPSRHMEYIDAFGGTETLLLNYKAEYAAYRKLKRQLDEISRDDSDKKRKAELLRFQIDEIEEAQITVGEEDELFEKRRIIKNSEALVDSLNIAYAALTGEDEYEGAISLIDRAADEVISSAEIMSDLTDIASRIEEIKYELKDFAEEIYSTADSIDFDNSELEEIEERLDVIYRLKKKYGDSEELILKYHDDALQQLDEMGFLDQDTEKLSAECEEKRNKVEKLAKELSVKRREAAQIFAEKVKNEAMFLNMPNVSVVVQINDTELTANGIDDMQILVTTNAGEQAKPLVKVASGGELSRIMLAIKSVLAAFDPVETMIFDEIDTGVSGIAAERIGQKLYAISSERQVICVTHLSQIASMADNHLLIEKNSDGQRTYTNVSQLDYEGRKREIARIISGSIITEAALQNAEQMIKSRG